MVLTVKDKAVVKCRINVHHVFFFFYLHFDCMEKISDRKKNTLKSAKFSSVTLSLFFGYDSNFGNLPDIQLSILCYFDLYLE